jgi:hypothetical protein
MRDLRISVTTAATSAAPTACPRRSSGAYYAFLPHDQILTFEEIERAPGRSSTSASRSSGSPAASRSSARPAGPHRDAGGAARTPDGASIDLTLTTNGAALRALAGPLAEAGLRRVTVSLDSLDDAVFGAMNGIDFPVARVLDGIDAALEAGLQPVKVNMVVRRGVNETSIVPMARWARETGVTLRFIEYMDVGHSNGWRLDEVVPAADVIAEVSAVWPAEPVDADYRGEVAGRWRYLDGLGEFGVISSGDPAVLPRLHPRATVRRRPALHLPVRGHRARRPRRAARRVVRRELVAFLAETWLAATTATPSCARARPPTCRGSRCSRWAAKPGRHRSSTGLSTAPSSSWTPLPGRSRTWWITALTVHNARPVP